jgi:ribosomal protein S18 acetylase RimI-like enzyme
MEHLFSNPFWHALKTEQAGIAIGAGLARRYSADVIPFGALEDANPQAMIALRDLLAPGEAIYVTGDRLPHIDDLVHLNELPGWQMHFAAEASADLPSEQPTTVQVRVLSAFDAPAMVALTGVAFPGFFRSRTHELGRYYGIHIEGNLVAMAGERVALPGFREISAVCTHPAHTGRGYAAVLIQHLLRTHSAAGLGSFLHVAGANRRAINLYERIGFTKTRPILFHRLRRSYADQTPPS